MRGERVRVRKVETRYAGRALNMFFCTEIANSPLRRTIVEYVYE